MYVRPGAIGVVPGPNGGEPGFMHNLSHRTYDLAEFCSLGLMLQTFPLDPTLFRPTAAHDDAPDKNAKAAPCVAAEKRISSIPAPTTQDRTYDRRSASVSSDEGFARCSLRAVQSDTPEGTPDSSARSYVRRKAGSVKR